MLSVFQAVFIFAFLVINVKTELYTKENSTLVFNFFKEKYNKQYTEQDEKHAYKNFIRNLNKVTALNANPSEKDKVYILNKYADINPEEIQEHFALNVSSYDVNDVYRGPVIRNTGILRNQQKTENEGKDLRSLELYDLDDADNLYKQYMMAFNKKKFTKKYDKTVHFYKFVKSLVGMNRDHYNGITNKTIDENADVISKPDEFFY